MLEKDSPEYRKGYWKALLDIYNFLDRFDDYYLKSKKQYKRFTTSLLKYLLKNNFECDIFRLYGGDCKIGISTKEDNRGEVTKILED